MRAPTILYSRGSGNAWGEVDVAELGVFGEEWGAKSSEPAAGGGVVRVNMGPGLVLLCPPLLRDLFLPAGGFSAADSVIGEKPRYLRVPVAGEGEGEGEGVGVQRSESPDVCPPSSRVLARKGSNFGRLTASSALW